MSKIEVTQADRDFAAPWVAQGEESFAARLEYRKEVEAGEHDEHPMVIAAAKARIAAAKAERDRLRELPDEVALKIYNIAGDAGIDLAPTEVRFIATALADALQQENNQ